MEDIEKQVDELAQTTGAQDAQSARTFIVLNPVAGATDTDAAREMIRETLEARKIDYDIYLTRKGDNLRKVVTQALDDGYQRVAAVGGDGTIALAASALVNRNIPLAVLPAGSGNGLARGLGIPLDLSSALDIALTSPAVRTIDAMQVGDNYFFLNVSAGLSSLTIQNTPRSDKRKYGIFAYILWGWEQFKQFRPFLFKVTIDGSQRSYIGSEVMVANTPFQLINPYTDERTIIPDDSLLDVCVVLSRRWREVPALAMELLTNRATRQRTLDCEQAHKEVLIESFRPLPVQGDGEIIGMTPVTLRLLPRALRVIVPAPPEPALVGPALVAGALSPATTGN
jgi:YegS/Rv2252/BmrU family lipid kinase